MHHGILLVVRALFISIRVPKINLKNLLKLFIRRKWLVQNPENSSVDTRLLDWIFKTISLRSICYILLVPKNVILDVLGCLTRIILFCRKLKFWSNSNSKLDKTTRYGTSCILKSLMFLLPLLSWRGLRFYLQAKRVLDCINCNQIVFLHLKYFAFNN